MRRAAALFGLLLAAAAAQSPTPGIAPQRALEIQNALIRVGYLDISSGVWDAATAAAMRKFQADHKWQVKFVPDARALIALGLGPAGRNAPTPRLAANH